MKIIGRILIILAVTALIGGAVYAVVNTAGGSITPFLGGDGREFRPGGELPRGQFQPGNGSPGNRPFRPEGGERDGGGGLLVGMVGNLAIITVIVTTVVLPMKWFKANRKAVSVKTNNGQSS